MSFLALAISLTITLAVEEAPSVPAIAAALGHGGMTVGVDSAGVLRVLRWPGPGGPDQLRQTPSPDAPDSGGGRWGVEVGGRWHWLGDPRARVTMRDDPAGGHPIIETLTEWPDTSLQVRQRIGVLPSRDLLISAIEIMGAKSAPRIVWLGDFAPATRQVPELPIRDGALDALNGFASFVDRAAGRAWTFRPRNPGKAEWTRAGSLAAADAAPEAWDEFRDGVWICLGSPGPAKNLAISVSAIEVRDAIDSAATVFSVAVGPARVGIELEPQTQDGVYHAAIALGAGESREATANAIAAASADIAAFLAAEPTDSSRVSHEFESLESRYRAMLRALRDPESGFTVRGPQTTPPQARDCPREGAFAAWALAATGDEQAAQKSVDAYLRLIATTDRSGRPFGSMPESVYTDGVTASPRFVVDDRAPARVLWVAARMLERWPAERRAPWARKQWKSIAAAGNFLSAWSDPRCGAPLWAQDPIDFSDAETQDRVFTTYAGLAAALRLAKLAGEAPPAAWLHRRDELKNITESILRTPGKWALDDARIHEFGDLSDETLHLIEEATLRRLHRPVGLDRLQLAGLSLQASLLAELQPSPDSADAVRAGLLRIEQDFPPSEPDSFLAAQILLTLGLRAEAVPSSPPGDRPPQEGEAR